MTLGTLLYVCERERERERERLELQSIHTYTYTYTHIHAHIHAHRRIKRVVQRYVSVCVYTSSLEPVTGQAALSLALTATPSTLCLKTPT